VSLPLGFDAPATARAEDGVLDTVMGGERVALHAERALHWLRERTVFVADVHLGKAAAFRAGGVPLPRGSTAADLARLTRLIERTSAARLVVLGDFLHARAGRVPAVSDPFVAWRTREIWVVRDQIQSLFVFESDKPGADAIELCLEPVGRNVSA